MASLSVVTWSSSATCGAPTVPTSFLSFRAPLSTCRSVPPALANSSAGARNFFSIEGCDPAPGVLPTMYIIFCEDSSCMSNCQQASFVYDPLSASAGTECTSSPFPGLTQVVTAMQCPSITQTVPYQPKVATVGLLTYPDNCNMNIQPSQFVPISAPLGQCTPFQPGPVGALTNGRFFILSNCTADVMSGGFCEDPFCKQCTYGAWPADPQAYCLPNPFVVGESAITTNFHCPVNSSAPPTQSKSYICNEALAMCMGTNVTGAGSPLSVCESICLKATGRFICVNGECVPSIGPQGVTKSECLSVCTK